jgi:hypothetical protein
MHRIALVVIALSSSAVAEPLASSVTELPIESQVVIVPKASGKTPVDRYRAQHGPMAANTPLVALVKLDPGKVADSVLVATARRDGNTIAIVIDNRIYEGVIHANMPRIPLIEIELGALKPGEYTMTVEERVSHFKKYDHPETATAPVPRLQEKLTITIQ